MARRLLLLLAVGMALVAAAAAAPCIECKDCRGSNYCLAHCERECRRPPVVVNVQECKSYGQEAGRQAAKLACDNTLLYCQGGQKRFGAAPYVPVSLQQCANAAYGVCQDRALNRWLSPCGGSFNGVKQCDKKTFSEFYRGEVDARCNQAVSWINGKKP